MDSITIQLPLLQNTGDLFQRYVVNWCIERIVF